MTEKIENIKEKIEKPKRTLTQAQLDNLERMRKKKLLKNEARKMIEEQTKQKVVETHIPPNSNPIKDYSNDIEDMKKELSYISTYIKEKQNKKKEQKVESVATQKTNDYLLREPVEYEYIPVRNSLINGIIRR